MDDAEIDLIPWILTFVLALLLGVDSDAVETDSIKADEDSMQKADYTILELNQGLVFPSAEHFIKKVLRGMLAGGDGLYQSVILDFTHVTGIDFTVIRSIEQLSEDFKAAGTKLVLCHVQRQVLKVLLKAKIKDIHYAASRREAINFIKDSAVSVGGDLSKIAIIPLPDMGASETQYEKLDLEFNQMDGTQSSIGSEASSDRLKEFMQANEGYKTEFCKF